MVAIVQDLSLGRSQQAESLVVVGTGPVGVRFVQSLHKQQPDLPITVFGDEPWMPYNRVQLTSLLGGETSLHSLFESSKLPDSQVLTAHLNNRIISINTKRKLVVDSRGVSFPYSALVLATGSRARMPQIPGIELGNVYRFRDLSDAETLKSRSIRSRHTVVIGGGLLGLEAARAMQRFNTQLTVLEHNSRLMYYQLDDKASRNLQAHIEAVGIKVRTGTRIKSLQGDTKVEQVVLANGDAIDCDTVIVAAGIIPNTELALKAGISIGQGIKVDSELHTSAPDVYAIGECAEYKQQIYGLVGPGYEQAEVLVHRLGGGDAHYLGSLFATQLKVVGKPVFSAGMVGIAESDLRELIHEDADSGSYHKLLLQHGCLVGAMSVGEWPEQHRIQEAIIARRRLLPWEIHRFRKTGAPWPDAEVSEVRNWPPTTRICNCVGVTVAELTQACKAGACSSAELAGATGASTVCGSCKPLLASFVGVDDRQAIKHRATLIVASAMALVVALITLLAPGDSWNTSVQTNWQWDQLWRNNLYKQISGFSLLGVSLAISLLSLRKRLARLNWGDFVNWRLFHVIVGFALVLVLLVHTGFRFGDNLNFYLMCCFFLLILTGSIAGLVLAEEHKFSPRTARHLRKTLLWAHIILLWPLPVLLSMHVLKGYYF